MRALAIIVALAGCATDEPERLPRCTEIGAGDELLCNRGGLCHVGELECCASPAPGAEVDEKCEAQP